MKITLHDIAKQTGVTPSTVQRALNGAPGVSDKKREEILRVAAELGYRRAFAVSARRARLRLAIVLTDTQSDNRFYATYMWKGVDQCLLGLTGLDIELVRITYTTTPDGLRDRLQEVLDRKYGPVDGVLTRGAIFPSVARLFKEFHERGIPVVLVGADSQPKYRICCVRSSEEMAGRMAAGLLLNFGAVHSGSRVIVCGNFTGIDQYINSQGFEREFWESNIQPNVMKIISDLDPAQVRDSILSVLDSGLEIHAIYSCSARGTLPVCEAVRRAGKAGEIRVIGSDLFEESIALLREGILSAVIHNRPQTLAARALQVLVDYCSGEDTQPQDCILTDAIIVMRSNLPFYIGEMHHSEDPLISLPSVLPR